MIVQGKITDQNGAPRSDLTVNAFDRNMGAEDTLLGKATTDEQGHYEISYTPDQLSGKAAADLFLSIYQDSRLLQTSDILFNAQPIETKDCVIAVAVSPEFNSVIEKVQPLSRNKIGIGELIQQQINFLKKKAGS